MAYQLYPTMVYGTPDATQTEKEYNLVMHDFLWFGASRKNIYFDENIRNNIIVYYRSGLIPDLAMRLQHDGETAKARKVLQKCFKELNSRALPYQYSDLYLAMAAYEAGMEKEGDMVVREILSGGLRTFRWLKHLNNRLLDQAIADGILEEALRAGSEPLRLAANYKRSAQFAQETKELQEALIVFWGNKAPSIDQIINPAPIADEQDTAEHDSLTETTLEE